MKIMLEHPMEYKAGVLDAVEKALISVNEIVEKT